VTSMDRRSQVWLLSIACVSLLLNLWGIDFGVPERWHPDEITARAVVMAREATLNPHEFRYGSLHFYQILAVIVPTYLVSKLLGLDYDSQVTLVIVAARALSALLGAGCVVLTFLLANRLFNATAAILSASFLAFAMGFATNAHFATVDVPMVFWMTASFLMATEVLLTGRRRAYVLAGLFAGLAASTKYPGAMALVCLLAAHLLAPRPRDHLALLLGFVASGISFVLANPPLLFASCEFFEGVIRDNAYSSTQGNGEAISLLIAANLVRGLGIPLFILVCPSLIYATLLVFRKDTKPKILLIAAMIVPSLLLLHHLNANYVRFVIPIFPPLAVLTGKATADLIAARSTFLRLVGAAVTFTVIALSALHTIAADLEMIHDSRELTVEWIARNVPEGATIEITSYVADPGNDRFRVVRRPRVHSVNLHDWIERLHDSPIYRTLHPIYLLYKSFAEDIGLCTRRPHHYRGWYDRTQAKQLSNIETFDFSLAGLNTRAPDVLIVSELYYDRYEDDQSSVEGRFFADLFAGKTSYRQVAEIEYHALPWPDPKVDFINPQIQVYQKTD
jgi:Dolichyl-phosphate-mannose-protein mannosyltransferase